MGAITWACNKDSRVATNGTNLGAGTSDFNPVGSYGGYEYRTLLGFSYSFAGMTAITSAVLKLRVSTQYYVGFTSDPDIWVAKVDGAWSEGSSSGLSTGNAVHWGNKPDPQVPTLQFDISTTEGAWVSLDVTSIIEAARVAGVLHGLILYAVTPASDVTEFYSREQGSSDPYLEIVFESNNPPGVPTLAAPVGGTASIDPDFSFSAVDPDVGDALAGYDIQVGTASGLSDKWDASNLTGGISGWSVVRNYSGTALTGGVPYWWRARVKDAAGDYGGWSSWKSFTVNRAPTVTFSQPSAADALVELVRPAGASVGPRMVVRWAFADLDAGDSQKSYQVVVLTDAGGAFYDSGKVNSTLAATTVPVDVTRAAFYKVTVTVWDQSDVSGTTGQRRCKANWGVVDYRIDTGGTPTAWSASPSSAAVANQKVEVEYGSTAAGGAVATWYSTLGAAGLARWFHFRVWLFAWSGAASPTFSRMSLTYTTATAVPPDGWTLVAAHSLDKATRVYGTQSLKAVCDGTILVARQLVAVEPNTDYILSGRVKASGNPGASIRLSASATGGSLAMCPEVVATQEFGPVQTPLWNSGANTQVWVQCVVNGAGGAVGWFDALKLEASHVVTPWTPGFIGPALSIDAGGIQVDKAAGGIFRLQGSAGGVRDIVELGASGLRYAGDTDLASPSVGVLTVGGVPVLLDANDVIDAANIAAGAVGGSELAGGAVSIANKVADGILTTAKLATAAKRMRMVAIDPFFSVANGATASAPVAASNNQITDIPAGLSGEVWAQVYLSIAHSGTGSVSVEAYHHGSANPSFNAASTGVGARYGVAMGWVRLGGTNNRQLKWAVPVASATTTYYVRVTAYATVDD